MKKIFLAIALFLAGGVCFAQGTSTGGGQGSGGGSGTVTSISCASGCTVANPTTTPAITVTASGGTVTSFSAGTLPPLFTTSVATATTTPALTFSLSTAAADRVFGNCTGVTAAPSFCALVVAQIPTAIPIANIGSAGLSGTSPIAISAAGAISCSTCNTSSATVTSFSAGALSPLFTSSVATATSTPALTFTLSNAGAGTVFGNPSSTAAAPSFTATPQLGLSGTLGSVTMGNATSGLLTLEPATGALGTVTVSIPAATDTLVNLTGTQALTNKSLVLTEINSGLTSGGVVCATSTTAISMTVALTSNIFPKGGGAGACPTNSSVTDNATTVTTSDTGGYVAPVFVSNGPTAGFFDFPQGSTSAAVAPCNTATSACIQAPAAVTSYLLDLPGAAPVNNNSVWLHSNASPSVGTFAKMPQTAIVSGTAYTNATTGFTSVVGSSGQTLSFSVEASTAYVMDCTLIYQSSVSTAGPKFQMTGPASPTSVAIAVSGATNTTAIGDGVVVAFSTPITSLGTAGATATNFPVTVTMGLNNGTNAGTVTVQAAANGTGTLTIQPGSYCTLQ